MMGAYSLVIGAGTNGVGQEVADELLRNDGASRRVFTPSIQHLDVTSPESIYGYLEQFGDTPIDEVVYSAGVNTLRWVEDEDIQHLQNTFAVNVFGLVLLASEMKRRWPDARLRMVVVVSDASEKPMRGSVAYCASKAALAMTVKNLAREMAPLWTVTGVSPGMIEDTAMTRYISETVPGFRNWSAEQAAAYEKSGQTLGRRVSKQEVAETVRFLLEGPESLNGSIITINGGN